LTSSHADRASASDWAQQQVLATDAEVERTILMLVAAQPGRLTLRQLRGPAIRGVLPCCGARAEVIARRLLQQGRLVRTGSDRRRTHGKDQGRRAKQGR
jgi:hypothetical protein